MDKIFQGIIVTIIGMGTVFVVLTALYFVMVLMKVFLYRDDKKQTANSNEADINQQAQELSNDIEEIDEEELVAVLTAAVAAILNQSAYNLKIKSYRRINQTSPSWNLASRREQIANRL